MSFPGKDIKDPEPVVLEIAEITQNGKIHIRFNQKLVVPPIEKFIIFNNDANSSSSITRPNQFGRRLQYFEKIDVTRDIFEFKYRLRNNIDSEGVTYDLSIKEWTEWYMILQLNFLHPREISKYDIFDHAIIRITNSDLFVSQETGRKIKKDFRLLQEGIPKQFGTNINTVYLDLQANLFIGAVRLIVAVMIGYSVWFGTSLRDLWVLLYVLQIVCYIVKSDVHIPITAGIFIEHLTRFIEFDLLDPSFYGKVADKQFSVDKWILGKPWSQT
jgi:hypothetical protein